MLRIRSWLPLLLLTALLLPGCAATLPPAPQQGSTMRFTAADVHEFNSHRARLSMFRQELIDQHFQIVASTKSVDFTEETWRGSYDGLHDIEVVLAIGTQFDKTKPCVSGSIRATVANDRARQAFERFEGYLRMKVMGQDRILS